MDGARDPRTKIVATVGPACADPQVLLGMIRAGADVFRVNGAHSSAEDIHVWVRRVREAGAAAGTHPGVLLDLPGPKIRLAALPEGQEALHEGDEVRLVPDGGPQARDPGTLSLLELTDLSVIPDGGEVLLLEGQIRLVVVAHEEGALRTRVARGGVVRRGMGAHFPGVALPTRVPTPRDLEIADHGIDAGVDMLGMSFVHSGDEVSRLRDHVERRGARGLVLVAKIERLDAVQALGGILAAADVAMVARGDLGMDAGPERVPSLQLRILEAGLRAGRPVIVATEMLESMTHAVRPTRAEASDVASAVFQGADAVMLSGETAVGDHPVHVVGTMSRILRVAEADPLAPYAGGARMPGPATQRGRPDQHVVRAAVGLARETHAHAIVVFSRTGMSAVRVSKERPSAPIVAFAPTPEICRRLAAAWGVRPHLLAVARGTDAVLDEVAVHLKELGLERGARAVLLMGSAHDAAGATTLIKLLTL